MRSLIVNMGLIAGFVAAITTGAVIDNRVRPVVTSSAVPTYAEMAEQRKASTVFGEFRTGARDMLWTRSETYLHGGVAFRLKAPQAEEEHQGNDAAHEHDESECPSLRNKESVVPDAANDWRGPLGDWERAVQPYFAPGGHKHKELKETLPLFRLMVLADPQFAKAYVVGANVICDSPSRAGEALAFLQDGLSMNPESIEIHTEIGRYRTYYLHDYERACSHLKKAIALGRHRSQLSEDETEAFRNAYHWLVLAYHQEGRTDDELKTAIDGLRHFPDDKVLERAIMRIQPDYLKSESAAPPPDATPTGT